MSARVSSRGDALPPPASLPPPRAAYIHVPFCRRRCGYCNFTLIAGRDDLIEAYLQALALELAALGEPRPVDTLFFGGGTPTHLGPARLRRLLRLARHWFPPAPAHECSVEANPGDITPDLVAALAEEGVQRVSLGVQSFQPDKLRVLERDHAPDDARRAIALLRPAVASLAIDLIFAAPGETLADWRRDLDEAAGGPIDHVSTYGLTYERGAAFWSRQRRGVLTAAGEDDELAMYLAAADGLSRAGFEHYEVSNFARPGHACRHNLAYWRGDGWFAAGPGASRFVEGRRETNHRSTTTWLRRVLAGASPVAESETLPPLALARERLVFGLRRLAGVCGEEFARATGFTLEQAAGPAIAKHVQRGALCWNGGRLRLTRAGLVVSDGLWPDFL